MTTLVSGSTLFTDAMALTPAGDGRYDGELNEHWTIGPKGSGPKVHGGAMLALCANAARMEHDGTRAWPIAISGNFLLPPDPGPMRSDDRAQARAPGQPDRRRADQGDRTAVRAAVTMGEPEHHVPPLLSVNPVVPLMTPEPPPGLEPIGPGTRWPTSSPGPRLRHPAVADHVEPRTDGGPPVIEYWVRPKGVAPDVLFALLCGDVSAPVTFGVNRIGWAPTVQLTAFLRTLPADGWLRVLCTTVQIGQDWFDEDHIVVDCEGHIVVQSRQLAMVPPPQ